jgi:hypothetical protein
MPTTELDPAELQAAITELMTHRTSYDARAELLTAGAFVADYGSLGDWYSGKDLAKLQLWTGSHDAAWHMITHWSIQRHDPDPEPPASFDEHEQHCTTCKYLETAYGLHLSFETEYCHECLLDLDKHEIAPDALGLAHAWCCAVKWTRREPWVHGNNWPGGDNQVEAGWDCAWWTQLSDGTFAVVTRYYYLAEKTDADSRRPDEEYVEEQTEYTVCTDWRDPGNTEINSTAEYVELDDPATMDTRQLALDAQEPTSAEWVAYAPESAQQLLVVGDAPGLMGAAA